MTTSPVHEILVERKDRIAHLTINRPAHKNALTLSMYSALAAALSDVNEDSAVRVVVLSGAQGSFTGGNDLGDFLQNPALGEAHPTVRFMRALYDCGKPVIAAVCGPAIGIGTTLLLHCDLVYAGESARFQTPFVNLGLCPEYASSLLLPQRMGYARAAEMLLLGEPFDAHKALACGLVNAVVKDEAALTDAMSAAQRLARQPARALRATKRLMKESQRELGRQVMQREIEDFMAGLQSAEFKEAVDAFFAKRKPDFSNFE